MSFADTVAAIREQEGVVYVPHPFDRMHSIPSPATLHRHLPEIDVLEVYNARLLFDAYNDEALRFARKYGLLAGAGSDAHVLQGVGTGALRMRRFDGPEEFLLSLRTARCCAGRSRSRSSSRSSGSPRCESARAVHALEEARRGPRMRSDVERRRAAGAVQPLARSVERDEIHERYLRRAIAEINELGDELLALGDELHVPVLGSGHPLGDVFLLKHPRRRARSPRGSRSSAAPGRRS